MGNVVSIKKASDDDLHALFTETCPVVPQVVNEKVQLAATHALGSHPSAVYQPSLKTLCFIVVGVCLLGTGLVKGFTTRWSNAVDSAALYTVQTEKLSQEAVLGAARPASGQSVQSWHRTKGAWAEYIARLERDPYYQYVQREKMRFEARYPSASRAQSAESQSQLPLDLAE